MHLYYAYTYRRSRAVHARGTLRLVGGCTWRHNNVGGVTAGLARHNSSNVGGVTAGQVQHNSSQANDVCGHVCVCVATDS